MKPEYGMCRRAHGFRDTFAHQCGFPTVYLRTVADWLEAISDRKDPTAAAAGKGSYLVQSGTFFSKYAIPSFLPQAAHSSTWQCKFGD